MRPAADERASTHNAQLLTLHNHPSTSPKPHPPHIPLTTPAIPIARPLHGPRSVSRYHGVSTRSQSQCRAPKTETRRWFRCRTVMGILAPLPTAFRAALTALLAPSCSVVPPSARASTLHRRTIRPVPAGSVHPCVWAAVQKTASIVAPWPELPAALVTGPKADDHIGVGLEHSRSRALSSLPTCFSPPLYHSFIPIFCILAC